MQMFSQAKNPNNTLNGKVTSYGNHLLIQNEKLYYDVQSACQCKNICFTTLALFTSRVFAS